LPSARPLARTDTDQMDHTLDMLSLAWDDERRATDDGCRAIDLD